MKNFKNIVTIALLCAIGSTIAKQTGRTTTPQMGVNNPVINVPRPSTGGTVTTSNELMRFRTQITDMNKKITDTLNSVDNFIQSVTQTKNLNNNEKYQIFTRGRETMNELSNSVELAQEKFTAARRKAEVIVNQELEQDQNKLNGPI